MGVTRQQPGLSRGRLVGRDWELDAIEQGLASARAGAGSVVVVEGPGGAGKSALLTVAAERGRAAGLRTLVAAASVVERPLPFGVALQLLEPVWLAAPEAGRRALLRGAARPAAELITGEPSHGMLAGGERRSRLLHALFAAFRNLASPAGDPRPGLMLVVDDLHWADAESCQLLAYLAQRVGGLPIVMVAAVTVGVAPTHPSALLALQRCERGVRIAVRALDVHGVSEMVRRRVPQAPDDVCAAVAAVTGGSPFLVQALLDQARQEELASPADVGRLQHLVPDRALDHARGWLEALPGPLQAVAVATAVLAGEATRPAIADFAGLAGDDLLAAIDGLVAGGRVSGGTTLRYVQPLLQSAVLAALSPAERARAHSRAVHVLSRREAPAAVLGPHLIAIPAGSDPDAARLARECAGAALQDGDATLAAALLGRALADQPPPELRRELLVDLALAEARAGMATAGARLEQARQLATDPRRAAEIALLEAERLCDERDYPGAASVLHSALAHLVPPEPELEHRVRTAFVAAAGLVPARHREALERRAQVLARLSQPPTAPERRALAHTLLHDSLGGAPLTQIHRHARLAWGDGALLRSSAPEDPDPALVLGALLLADDLDLAEELLTGDAGAAPGTDTSPSAPLEPLSVWILYIRGEVETAAARARAWLERPGERWPAPRAVALAALACCEIETGDVDRSEATLRSLARQAADHPAIAPAHLTIQAELRLAQHRPEEALAAAMDAGARTAPLFPTASGVLLPWRSTAATAHLALGRPDRALELIEPDLRAAQRLALPRHAIRGLRLKGLAVGGAAGRDYLAEAVAIGDATAPRLEHLRALVDLGAALRRSNRRAAARTPLSRAVDLATRGGATAIAQRARTELIASGARPRRLALTGIDSLTASQHRVAALAARGLTTRQIAEALFVTPKTVEFHLRHVYQKLDVRSRAELAELFTA